MALTGRGFRLLLTALAVMSTASLLGGASVSARQRADVSGFNGGVLYVAGYNSRDGGVLTAYQEGTWSQIGRWTGIDGFSGTVRGTAYDAGYLYFSVGGDGGGNGNGGLVKWDLVHNREVWYRSYPFGVDQLAACRGYVYEPVGETAASSTWEVISEVSGSVVGSIRGGYGPHNTICVGGHLFLGGRYDASGKTGRGELFQKARCIAVRCTRTGKAMGPSPGGAAGIRPFTVGRGLTRAWITWSYFRGFSIVNTKTGRIVRTVNFGPVPCGSCSMTTWSHGITVDPADRHVYVLDTYRNQLREYTTSDNPSLQATLTLPHGLYHGTECTDGSCACAYDCSKVGWLQDSYDGAYVFVGDSGDILRTSNNTFVAYLQDLSNTRHGFIDVDWLNGAPVMGGHFGIGHDKSTTKLTASIHTASPGKPVTLTVRTQAKSGVPSGVVTITDTIGGVVTRLATLSLGPQGVASLRTLALPVGAGTIRADYLGDSGYFGSAATTRVSIN